MMRSPAPAFDLRASLSQELHAALEALETSEGRPKRVHRCRVHIKRARALARVGKTCAPGLSKVFNDSARAVMRQLAGARDLAALAEAARVAAKRSSKREAAALTFAAESLDAERAFMPALDMEAAKAGLKDLIALAHVWPEASARQIKRGAERIARRARKARRRGRGADEPVRRHEWRKREKDRFYAAELLNGSWPSRRRRKLGEQLGDVLGRERDALLLIARIEDEPALAGGAKPARRALRALNLRRRRFADRADGLGADLHASGV